MGLKKKKKSNNKIKNKFKYFRKDSVILLKSLQIFSPQ